MQRFHKALNSPKRVGPYIITQNIVESYKYQRIPKPTFFELFSKAFATYNPGHRDTISSISDDDDNHSHWLKTKVTPSRFHNFTITKTNPTVAIGYKLKDKIHENCNAMTIGDQSDNSHPYNSESSFL